jgi:hypothetical protein
MQELIPVGYGLLLGVALGFVQPSVRLAVGAGLAIMLGFLTTVITGEFALSWSYVLVDIPLVALPALFGILSVRRMSATRRPSR